MFLKFLVGDKYSGIYGWKTMLFGICINTLDKQKKNPHELFLF